MLTMFVFAGHAFTYLCIQFDQVYLVLPLHPTYENHLVQNHTCLFLRRQPALHLLPLMSAHNGRPYRLHLLVYALCDLLQTLMLMGALHEELHMQMERATALCLHGSEKSIASPKDAALRLCIAAEKILARVAAFVAVRAIWAHAHP